ncbi:MAG: UDP-2,3-diacylglucosamine diphosphatase [bacterium]
MNLPVLQSPVLFVADSHLPLIVRTGQEHWRSRMIRFLRQVAPQFSSLVILGDLFDFWFEWRYVIPSPAFPVLSALYDLHRLGIDIVYIAGNHDGHIGKFLTEEIGVKISRRPMDVIIEGLKVHLIHGDGIAPSDSAYRILRGIVRAPITESLFRLVHPDLGIWLAHKLSRFSRQTMGKKKPNSDQYYREYAFKRLESGDQWVVMGHRHQAELIHHYRGGFLAIGDWIRSGSYGLFREGRAELAFYTS